MATQITKAEFDALPDSLKTKFQVVGDEYLLDEPDVTGLKKNKEDILVELAALKKKYEGVDPDKARTALEAAAKAEDERARKEGEFDKLLEQREAAWSERISALTTERDTILSNLHREAVKSELVKRGGLPDRVDYLAGEIVGTTEFSLGESGGVLKKKGGIGDAAELDALFTDHRQSKPFFFASDNASGSGASGSDKQGGGIPKTATKAELASMDQTAKREFYVNGGEITP